RRLHEDATNGVRRLGIWPSVASHRAETEKSRRLGRSARNDSDPQSAPSTRRLHTSAGGSHAMIEQSGLPVEEITDLDPPIPHILADFAQMKSYVQDPFILDQGQGVYVFDVQGRRYIDTLAGTASVSVGHRNPDIIEAMVEQLRKMTFASPNSSVNS